jgi:hypothetical protein
MLIENRYSEVFGFRRIRSDRGTDRAETADAPIFNIYPKRLNKVKMAFMSAGNGVGFEIFEFQDPAYKKARDFNSEFNAGGFFHIAITMADPGMLHLTHRREDMRLIYYRWNCKEGN